jgi:hypothetical protein
VRIKGLKFAGYTDGVSANLLYGFERFISAKCSTARRRQRITSVAWKRREEGMVRPSAWAVVRLMTSSNVVACSTGSSAGLAPVRSLSTEITACEDIPGRLGP